MRHYVAAWELKQAGLDWRSLLLSRCLSGRALLVAQLQADPHYGSEAERVQAFLAQGGGARFDVFQLVAEAASARGGTRHPTQQSAAGASGGGREDPAAPAEVGRPLRRELAVPAGQAGQSKSPRGLGRVPRRPGALLPCRLQARGVLRLDGNEQMSGRASAAGVTHPIRILLDFAENPLELVRTSR